MVSRAAGAFAAIALTAVAAACAVPPGPAMSLRPTARVTLPDRLLVRTAGKTVSVNLEEYVVDTILSEVSPVGDSNEVVAQIFEVQAIVARTYAVARAGRHRDEGFDVCDTTHCQLYQPARRRTSRFTPAALQAAARTHGEVLTYQAVPIEALFHADCGGSTVSADAVWGGVRVPYLRTVLDNVDEAAAHRAWQVAVTSERVRAALNADPRTRVGRTLTSITVASRDDSGRAAGLSIRGERSYAVRGDVLRAVLNRALGDRAGVLSTMFTIERRGQEYQFAGTGFGHGVGLCQRGAAARIRQGSGTRDILSTYYPGTRLITAH